MTSSEHMVEAAPGVVVKAFSWVRRARFVLAGPGSPADALRQ